MRKLVRTGSERLPAGWAKMGKPMKSKAEEMVNMIDKETDDDK